MKQVLLTLGALFFSAVALAEDVDIAILNGQIVDGTNSPAFQADILIKDGKIVFIGDAENSDFQAATVIDAADRWVTPGFIDLHAHGNPLIARSFDNFLTQGVTTVTLGQDGVSPMFEQVWFRRQYTHDTWRAAASGDVVDFAKPITLRHWMQAVENRGIEVNIAPMSGHGTGRRLVGAYESNLSASQKAGIEEMVRADMEAGAWGISSGLEYVPGRYSSLSELVDLAKIVGEYDGLILSHIRSEDEDKIARAIDEAIAQGKHARVGISHLKIVYGKSASDAENVLSKIRSARENGIEIIADTYPYLAGYACMTLVYPSWAKRQEEWEDAVANKRTELEAALRARVFKRNGPEAILIGSGEYAGKTLKEVADQLGKPFEKVLIDDFGYCGPGAAHRIMREDIQEQFIAAPDVAISTDGGPWINHPRSWGGYPKVLDEYTLRKKLMPVELAIHKMTGLPANFLKLPERGTLKIGNAADVLVIDPVKIKSNATWTDARQAASGFDAVIVNGHLALHNDQILERQAGQMLRRVGVNDNDLVTAAFDQVVTDYQKAIQKEGVVGGSVALVRPENSLVRRHFGVLEREVDRLVDDDTIFHWASVSKVFTAVAAMQLVERGKLSLDDAVVDFIPELRRAHNPYGSMSDINIRHLLTHSAGFRGSTFPWNVDGDKAAPSFQAHEPKNWAQLEATFPYTGVRFKPGTKASYSNLGITVLGRIIEIVSGETIEGYISKNIFMPLEMHDSFFDASPWHLKEDRVHGYWLRDGEYVDNGSELDSGITHANGGINATIADMAKFVSFLLGESDDSILRRDTLDAMLQPQLDFAKDPRRELSIGLGFFVIDETNSAGKKQAFFGHAGYQGGHRSAIYIAKDGSGAFLLAVNTARRGLGNPSAEKFRMDLVDSVFPLLRK